MADQVTAFEAAPKSTALQLALHTARLFSSPAILTQIPHWHTLCSPGHGQSSKALFPDKVYTMDGLSAVIIDAVRALKVSDSLAGWLASDAFLRSVMP